MKKKKKPIEYPSLSRGFTACQAMVRLFTLHKIKHHAPLSSKSSKMERILSKTSVEY